MVPIVWNFILHFRFRQFLTFMFRNHDLHHYSLEEQCTSDLCCLNIFLTPELFFYVFVIYKMDRIDLFDFDFWLHCWWEMFHVWFHDRPS
ncbi:hypothetical protein C2G38_2062268 [Gigaspora rosea]|uniref:Fatty acid hydroxylase domain-containing protein n=1 Tax=Gigaspora rosea TaxID=44941 RepID=A0A397VXX7_9GLOM|nr:hypothetical protein C2G38_2062268 [Gigaspora rosea]